MKIHNAVVFGTACALLAGGVEARTAPPTGVPASVQQLMACRSIADSAQRLACYDRQAGVIEQAIAKRDLLVIDKQRAEAAQRGLFGFATTGLAGLFGGGEIKQIESTVAGYTRNADGGWIVRLADGSVWSQTDDAQLGLPPERGDKVKITRGFGGSFFLQLGKQPGFRAKRIG